MSIPTSRIAPRAMRPTVAERPSPILEIAVVAVVWSVWLTAVFTSNLWQVVADNLFMAITMAAGSFIAGSTSEGGGAVAFPVMTLVFGIQPAVARDFAFMIQSVGMTAAAITIFHRRIPVERRALVAAGLGGSLGLVVGIEWIAPLLAPAPTKIFFVSLWLAFGAALVAMNRRKDRPVRQTIDHLTPGHIALLVGAGVIGGVVSGLTGSGLDIVTFSLLVLTFRIDEKVATPTSVVLMASNAVVGFAWRGLFAAETIPAEAWGYWWAAVPVVVVGAPLGARVIAGRSRMFVVRLLAASIVAQFVGALVILPTPPALLLFSGAVIAGGLLLFGAMARLGAQGSADRRPSAAS